MQCQICRKPIRGDELANVIETYWASGNHYYCAGCWSRHRDYYENESGQRAWKPIGRYYAPID